MATNKTNNFRIFELEKSFDNPMAASVNERLIELRKRNIAQTLAAFQGCGHKLEQVKSINGIEFIDDASSTNADATWFSLQRMNKPTVWITNFNNLQQINDDLLNTIYEKVKYIVLQGVYSSEVYAFLEDLDIPFSIEMNMEDAVRQAFYACEKGYAILYSPCSASTNGETSDERGRSFKVAAAQL